MIFASTPDKTGLFTSGVFPRIEMQGEWSQISSVYTSYFEASERHYSLDGFNVGSFGTPPTYHTDFSITQLEQLLFQINRLDYRFLSLFFPPFLVMSIFTIPLT